MRASAKRRSPAECRSAVPPYVVFWQQSDEEAQEEPDSRGPHPERSHRGRVGTGGAGPGLVLLPGEQNPLPVPSQVHRGQGGFTTPQGRNGSSPAPGSRRCLRQRHARADPLAGQEDGRSPVATDRPRRPRINHRGHRRLALLGGPRLLLLNHRQNRVRIYAGLPKAHKIPMSPRVPAHRFPCNEAPTA